MGFIFVRPDGHVEPSQAPIERSGETYTLTADIYDPIILERDNVILEGAGHYLLGNGAGTPLVHVSSGNGPSIYLVGRDNGIGINVTCTNATVTNIHIVNWVAGIDMAYGNNTVSANFISNCQTGVKVFGLDNKIVGNYVGTNVEGARIAASQSTVSRNNFTGNQIGIRLYYSNQTVIENSFSNVVDDIIGQWAGNVTIYHNNFLNGDEGRHLQFDKGHSGVSPNAAWDNGYPSGGNYWLDYTGVDSNKDGIGDTPYEVKSVFNYPNIPNMPVSSIIGKDNFPLMKQFAVTNTPPNLQTRSPSPTQILPPSPTNTSAPTNYSSPTPMPTVPEFPNWVTLLLLICTVILSSFALKNRATFSQQAT